jgi:hypothetical protein
MESAPNLWGITVGHAITWMVVGVGVVLARYIDLKMLDGRVAGVEKWRETHEADERQRDTIITELRLSNATLITLAKHSERRIQRLEDRDDRRADGSHISD